MATEDVSRLSRRELETLSLLCHGLTDKEAAARMGISLGTVRVYRGRLQTKLGAQGLMQCALVAWATGQLDLGAIAERVMAQCTGTRRVPFEDSEQEQDGPGPIHD